MKRWFLLPAVSAVVAVFASAQEVGRDSEPTHVQQLLRNQKLVHTLVDGGLSLAAADGPINRAECVSKMAEHLAREIREAALNKEGDRALELGQHLQSLLKKGVASNLHFARSQTTAGSTMAPQLVKVGEELDRLLRPMEQELEQLRAGDQDPMGRTLTAIRDGRKEVERAIVGPGPVERKKP